MTLARLLACVVALVGIWNFAMGVAFIQISGRGLTPPLWFYAMLALDIALPCLVVLLRNHIAHWILGSAGARHAPFDHRAILAVASASIGIHLMLKAGPPIMAIWFLAILEQIDPTKVPRYPAAHLFTSILLIVGARFVPLLVGWGRLAQTQD